jgi:hypothetical protein
VQFDRSLPESPLLSRRLTAALAFENSGCAVAEINDNADQHRDCYDFESHPVTILNVSPPYLMPSRIPC